ncbi:MAG: RNA polymerase sigma factor (sigma-70 family) [Planctomycetota bacterium]|jgi:RNA polymerase sigma factor (sigma-70 family)
MNERAKTTSVEVLLAQADWVRSVARRLVRDDSTADDVAQSSWVAALESPPSPSGNLRNWFSRVVSNRARQAGRGESRCRSRERIAAKPESGSTMDDLAERASRQREVVGYVLSLDEPFRSVVLLRFFEDMTLVEIAARLNVPLKTVHSRLQRAFDKLRQQLDSEYGNRSSWAALLLPLANFGNPQTTGIRLMNTNAKIALTVGALLLGGIGIWDLTKVADNDTAAAPAITEAAMPKVTPDEETGLGGQAPRNVSSERIAELTPVLEVATSGQAETFTVRGHILDIAGNTVVGVEVFLSGAEQLETSLSSADGAFELQYEEPIPVVHVYFGEGF